ncbi:hypothetical protein [Marinoscillum luteum]|uniref:Uncharacterized protein n=1 Tax=Marinoscillum luteum TaxID=861051 RepID=A0ABW7NDG3_9BACT
MTHEDILAKLNSTKSADRKRGAREIGKLKSTALGSDLYEAYLKEKWDKRTWETQVEMIRSLGIIQHKEAISEMEEIVMKNKPHDMVTSVASTTFIQLARESVNDARKVIELLKFGSVSVISGSLLSLPTDRMIPPREEIKEVIERSWDINKHPDRIGHEFGLIDSRIYLALQCADWDIEFTSDFLNHCIETAFDISRFGKPVANQNLIAVCENSLKGKFSKGYI